MKLQDIKQIKEATLPPAESESDLFSSIADGKFSRDGSHLEVTNSFDCSHKKLSSLIGVPTKIIGNFYADHNMLTSLEGAPTTIAGGSFYCSNNKLTSLEGLPSTITHSCHCSANQLTSLKGIHTQIEMIGKSAFFTSNPIKSHVLGLLKIKNLRRIELDNIEVRRIINKYLPEGDIFACQQELIDAGFEEYAQL